VNVDEIYACRCGAAKCRGTMLWPAKRPVPRKKKKKVAKKVAKTASTRTKRTKRKKPGKKK
jgi:hypothetical protein